MRAFKPAVGGTVSLAVTTTSASVAMLLVPDSEHQVRLYNAGSATVFVNRGGSGVTATTSNMPLPAGAVEVLTYTGSATHLAAITASGTATLYATVGEGI